MPVLLHLLWTHPDEPVFGGDSNRHVVTSIFFRDFIIDGQYSDPKGYAERYYEQYPALGLLVWPPLFHGVAGVLMLAFGTSAAVARGLVLASLIVSCLCVHRITRRTQISQYATLVTVVFAISPLIFEYSRDVMLEMPTLALVLLSVDWFDCWLRRQQSKFLYGAAVTAALAALTRFDAAVLLPFYLTLLIIRGGWKQILARHLFFAAGLAILLTAPTYLLILKETGNLHVRQAVESVGGSEDGTANAFLALKNLTYYPFSIPEQVGWLAALLAAFGIIGSFRSRESRQSDSVFASLMIATYVTFTPLAELRSRHAIYWVPSIAFFAVTGTQQLLLWWADRRQHRSETKQSEAASVSTIPFMATSLLMLSGVLGIWSQPTYRVQGYRTAAEYVISNTDDNDSVFFDGWWDGNFTYQMRHLDASRSRKVIRGDRLLYDFVCVPSTDFQKFVQNEHDIVAVLTKANPRFILFEDPQFFETVAVAQQLRDVVKAHPDIFEPVCQVPVSSSIAHLPKFQIQIFRFHPEQAVTWMNRTESQHASQQHEAHQADSEMANPVGTVTR
ncbi:MAG: ArnT family glycosyltransferase [Planctomyces sp.]